MLRPSLVLLLLFLFFNPFASLFATEQTSQAWVEFHGQRFYVEIAADAPSRARGLMLRNHMDDDHGMLFIFPDEQPRRFWMKNTLIPLDIIYMDSQLRVVSITAGAQPCRSTQCPTYPSHLPAKFVLEINADLARSHDLKIGDEISVFVQ